MPAAGGIGAGTGAAAQRRLILPLDGPVAPWSEAAVTYRLVYWLVLAASAAYVLARGGAPERWGMAVMVIGSAADPLVLAPMAERFRGIEWGGLAVDLAVYAAFLVLAITANRFWPLWVSAMQGVGTATHLLGLAGEAQLNLTYALLSQIWAYPTVLAIVAGTVRHRMRRARQASEPPWKSFSARSTPV